MLLLLLIGNGQQWKIGRRRRSACKYKSQKKVAKYNANTSKDKKRGQAVTVVKWWTEVDGKKFG